MLIAGSGCTKPVPFFDGLPLHFDNGQGLTSTMSASSIMKVGRLVGSRSVLQQVPMSELCDKQGLQPTVFDRWQKEFFENGAPPWD
jgi:hypothetical protein